MFDEIPAPILSVLLHLGFAVAAMQASKSIELPKEARPTTPVYTVELTPAPTKKIIPLKNTSKKTKKKVVKAKKSQPKKAAKKKRVVTQKQKSPVKVAESKKQKATSNESGKAKAETTAKIVDARQFAPAPGNPLPEYPKMDRLLKKTGRVTLIGYVSKKGNVSRIRVAENTGSSRMQFNSVQAFSQYKFESGKAAWVKMPFEFILDGEPQEMSSRERRLADRVQTL